jgi:hypothetical protein
MLASVGVDVDQSASEIGRFADIFLEQPNLVSGKWHITIKQVVGMDKP